MSQSRLCFTVPKELVKTVKSKLEQDNSLDKQTKITPHRLSGHAEKPPTHFLVPTTLSSEDFLDERTASPRTAEANGEILGKNEALLSRLGLFSEANRIGIVSEPRNGNDLSITRCKARNPVHKAMAMCLQEDMSPLLKSLDLTAEGLLSCFPETYAIYHPMLLLPAHAFRAGSWSKLLFSISASDIETLYTKIAEATGTTHVAINAPIPSSTDTSQTTTFTANSPADPNILRSPTHLQPLKGFFGPTPSTHTLTCPTPNDFSSALWVTAVQNGIHQTWAPLYTMFSRGNIREKTRLLHHPNVQSMSSEEAASGGRWTAVDLYAGIGYFAFSYAKAGASDVLCWELNPWSVEGLRRGVELNKWNYVDGRRWCDRAAADRSKASLDPEEAEASEIFPASKSARAGSAQLIVFNESNEHAGERIGLLRDYLPRVRHVNLGLLPTSAGAYGVAVQALDPISGGWLHVHENISSDSLEMAVKTNKVVEEISAYLEEMQETKRSVHSQKGKRLDVEEVRPDWTVRLEHIEKVKTYAPGVVHCVLDVFVGPSAGRRH